MRILPFPSGSVAPFVATSGREVVEDGWCLESLLKTLAALGGPGDLAVWEDDSEGTRLVAVVFPGGAVLKITRLVKPWADPAGAAECLREALGLLRGEAPLPPPARALLSRAADKLPGEAGRLLRLALGLHERGKVSGVPALVDRVEAELGRPRQDGPQGPDPTQPEGP